MSNEKGNESGIAKRLKNLRPPIKPGEKRNPAGYSKKAREHYEFRKWIQETCPKDPIEVFQRLSSMAKSSRDFRYLQEYLDRYQGKVESKEKNSGGDTTNILILTEVSSKEVIEESAKLREMFKK